MMLERGDGEDKNEYPEPAGTKWSQKSPLEKTLSAGVYGIPEIKKSEKEKYLGQFRERVIKALTLEQILEEGVYNEIVESIKDPRAEELIISKKADLSRARDYIMLARENRLNFTTVSSPDYRGKIGLVVAAGEAIDEKEVMVPSRREKMLRRGIPEKLVDAKGKKVCPPCYRLLQEKAPEYVKEYIPFSWWEKLIRKKCSADLNHTIP